MNAHDDGPARPTRKPAIDRRARAGRPAASFDGLLEGIDPGTARVCLALRERLMTLHAGVTEVVWPLRRAASYGIGTRVLSEHYAEIAPRDVGVRLGFYRGAFLNDPAQLLRGTGPRRRHVFLPDVDSTASPALLHLLRQAISERLAART